MLQYTIGDTNPLLITVTTDGATPWNLTGATFAAALKNPDGSTTSFDSSHFSIVNAVAGMVTFTPTPTESNALKASGGSPFALTITQSAVKTTVHGKLQVLTNP
jgi:hypothetical protein